MNEIISIDPCRVPKKKLYTGDEIPAVGIGTFGSDNYEPETIASAVKEAIKHGYRHIDCAAVYGNEKEIGCVLRELFEEGIVKREDLWITSKVWNDMHDRVEEACLKSLSDLGLDYLDLYLVHWPFPNYHAPKADVESRDPNARPYIHEEYMKVWRAMESLVDKGLVRNIGTSNMTRPKMELLLRDCRIKPSCNEMELHPHFQQKEFKDYIESNGILTIGFCPIGSPNRPERDKTPEDTNPIEDPVLVVGLGPVGLADQVLLSNIEALDTILAMTDGNGVERAIDCSGNTYGRQLAIRATRKWGKIAFIGEGGSVEFFPSPDIIHGQKTIYGSWVTTI